MWGAAEGSSQGDRLEILATLVEAYESKRWPIQELDPVEAIEAAMASEGRSRGDLAELIGQSRATEILQRRRPLTLAMIRKIAAAWRMPERLLVKAYPLADEAKAKATRGAARRLGKADGGETGSGRRRQAG